ncbi:MAG: hypothetical protein RR191_05055 [Cetobacterium sp.]|uniref:hypothetical protein n=1 Tax=unclassified Cetobacterium TaxID=2630983 RepID=UPI00163C2007|nr:hypothetical protein [Cetobacterium sp. 2A]MBC2856915.1 hypothetical protein [Cetobacterium sp. 2A]
MRKLKIILLVSIFVLMTGCFNGQKSIELVKNSLAPNVISLFTGNKLTIGKVVGVTTNPTFKNFKENNNNFVEVSWDTQDKGTVKIIYLVNLETSKIQFSKIYSNNEQMNEIFYYAIMTALTAEYNKNNNK